MNATDPTPLSPQAHADLMDTARARAVCLREQAKAEFAEKVISGAAKHLSRLAAFLARTLASPHSKHRT